MANEPTTTLVGNLAADPEIRYSNSGTPICSFTIVQTPRTFNKATNQWEDGEPLWVRCTVWRDFAENVSQSLRRGMRVIATGKFGSHSYEYNGQQRRDVVMQVDAIGPEDAARLATCTIPGKFIHLRKDPSLTADIARGQGQA